jgi:hypothetical protein
MATAKDSSKKSALDLLKKAKGGAATKKATSKKDDRWTIVLDTEKHEDVLDLCQLATIMNQLKPTHEERAKSVKEDLLKQFCEKWWTDRKLPQNPKIVLRKNGSTMDDMSFMFMVKYRESGLTNVVPNVEDLPEDKTVEDLLLEMLMSKKVGLSEKNAEAMLNEEDGEIKVVQKLQLSDSLDALLANSATESAATKLLSYLGAEDDDEIEVLTSDEKSSLLQTVQIVTLKEGFYERATKYVDNAVQLRNLIEFVKATLQISNYEFAISDTPVDRAKRMQQAAEEYLTDTY